MKPARIDAKCLFSPFFSSVLRNSLSWTKRGLLAREYFRHRIIYSVKKEEKEEKKKENSPVKRPCPNRNHLIESRLMDAISRAREKKQRRDDENASGDEAELSNRRKRTFLSQTNVFRVDRSFDRHPFSSINALNVKLIVKLNSIRDRIKNIFPQFLFSV